MAPPTSVRRFGRRSPPRTKVVSGIRRTAHGRRSILANSNQVDMLEKVKKILNKPSGFLRSDQEASEDDKKSSRLKVAVRVRPLSQNETKANHREVVAVAGPQMLVFDPPIDHQEFFFHNKKQKDITAKKFKDQKFAFDYVYDPEVDNQKIYHDVISPLLSTLMTGVNCSVFAYGATGSGKTYTMLGTPSVPGLTYLAMTDLYVRLDEASDKFDFQIVVSYFEVYNEQVRDLLNHTGEQLQVREIGTGIDIGNLSYHRPRDVEHLMLMLKTGNSHRSQHPTDHNSESSRSHALLQVQIQLRERHSSMSTTSRSAKLVMVDLAGSEKGAATGCSGQRFREGSSINKSLLALGNCISALASGKKFIQFRDSKLTRILKDSLGGNCKTVMVANISPSETLYDDTLNTLRYAEKAKKISCNTKKNLMTVQSCLSQYTRVVDEMAAKIETLETENRNKDIMIATLQEAMNERYEEIKQLRAQLDSVTPTPKEPAQLKGSAINFQILPDRKSFQITTSEEEDTQATSNLEKGARAMRLFIDAVDSDSETKRQIRKAIENYTFSFELTNKRFERYQSMYTSTGDNRYSKASKRAQRKMGHLVKKLQFTLNKVTDLMLSVESVYTNKPRCRYSDYDEMWSEIEENVPMGQVPRSMQVPTADVLGYLIKQRMAEEVITENGNLKSQLSNLMKRCDEKDDQLCNAVDLITKLNSIVKHYEHDTPTLTDQFENFVSSFCGSSVHFADDKAIEETEEEKLSMSDTMIQDSPEGKFDFMVENPTQFYQNIMNRLAKTWKSSDELSAELLDKVLKAHQDKAEKMISGYRPTISEDLKLSDSVPSMPSMGPLPSIRTTEAEQFQYIPKVKLPDEDDSSDTLDQLLADISPAQPKAMVEGLPESTVASGHLPFQSLPMTEGLSAQIKYPPSIDSDQENDRFMKVLQEVDMKSQVELDFLANTDIPDNPWARDQDDLPPLYVGFDPPPPSFMGISQQVNRIGLNTTTDSFEDLHLPESLPDLSATVPPATGRFDGTFVLEPDQESCENKSPPRYSGVPHHDLDYIDMKLTEQMNSKSTEEMETGMDQPKVPKYKKTPFAATKKRSPKVLKSLKKAEMKARNQPTTFKAGQSRVPKKSPSSGSSKKMSTLSTYTASSSSATSNDPSIEPFQMATVGPAGEPGGKGRGLKGVRKDKSGDGLS